ncbi:MAG TPA: ACT domain-containing protein [Myxococcales bacterium]|jgi:glycine cleavage system transcriptional repressor
MTEHALITAVGEDKPGLVAALSAFVAKCGCNIEDSRMAILGSEFAMHILVAGEAAALAKLLDGINQAGSDVGLAVTFRKTQMKKQAGAVPYELNAYSMDHPGIVQRVTELLAERKVNIRGLETRVANAPHTGQPLFSLYATIDVPASEKVAGLRKALADLGASENIDVELKPAS